MSAWSERYASAESARAAIVAEARTWVGTQWRHAHELKGCGVDCAQLLRRVYIDSGVIEPFETGYYPRQWNLNHDAPRFLKILEAYGHRVQHALPGDIAMYKFGKHAAHGAIVVDDDLMIHAYLPADAVILDSRNAMPGNFDSLWSLFP